MYVLLQTRYTNDHKRCTGNKIEQSAAEITGAEEHIRLADIHKVSEYITPHNKHRTHLIDQYKFLELEQNQRVHESNLMVNHEQRRRQRDGRSNFHRTRCNPYQGLTPTQNKAKVRSKQTMVT